MSELSQLLGRIDIYLLDQLLRGRIRPGMRILDTGCGTGRNIEYLLRAGFEVYGVDPDPSAIAEARRKATALAPRLPAENFRVERVEQMTFPDQCADVVISNAVLHFARDEPHFWQMVNATWRVLRPRGLLFCRLASTIGIRDAVRHLQGRRFEQPDGSERFLVDEALLTEATRRLGGTLADPLKTTVVQGKRSMTTWVVNRSA